MSLSNKQRNDIKWSPHLLFHSTWADTTFTCSHLNTFWRSFIVCDNVYYYTVIYFSLRCPHVPPHCTGFPPQLLDDLTHYVFRRTVVLLSVEASSASTEAPSASSTSASTEPSSASSTSVKTSTSSSAASSSASSVRHVLCDGARERHTRVSC